MSRNLLRLIGVVTVIMGFQVSVFALPLYRDSLPNGLILLTYEDHRLPVVDVQLTCRSGSACDPSDKSGTATLTARLLGRGTTTLSADSFASIVDYLGMQFGTRAGVDDASISAKVLTKDLGTALDLLADAVLHPTFDEKEFQRARSQALGGAKRVLSDPRAFVDREFNRLQFAGHPLANDPSGDTVSLPRLNRDDLAAYHGTYYVPNNCFVVVVGDVEPEAVRREIGARFGAWDPGVVPALNLPELTFPPRLKVKLVNRKDMNQTYVVFGHPGITMSDTDRIPTRLMSYVLGGGAMSSRLGIAVREKKGLAYDVGCYFERTSMRNAFRAAVQTAKPKEAIQLMFDEIRLMHDNGATRKELDKAHNYYTGSFPLTYSSSAGKLSQMHDMELYRLGMDFLEKYPDRVRAVTLDRINAAARNRLQPGHYFMVVMGNVTREDLGLTDVDWIE
jgi:zinc protease